MERKFEREKKIMKKWMYSPKSKKIMTDRSQVFFYTFLKNSSFNFQDTRLS